MDIHPQGMLEPWSRNQKPLRKWVYYHLIEKPMTQKASLIRAVGKPEFDNLSKSFNHVVLIPNGIDIPLRIPSKETIEPIQFLFMARLHHKKGIVPLVEGWIHSALKNHQGFRLVIAGPDQGELSKIMNLIQSSHTSNIVCKVAVYGEEKETLLQQSHFYVLPSFSEGFPTGVIEAMSRGLIPLISRGCNFPEAFNTQLAISAEPDSQKLIKSLEFAAEIDKNKYSLMSLNVYEFVKNHYSLEHIADMQSTLYKTLI
jgi:glycosyltransferase involved in cell wall biosynthesis